MRRRLTTVLLSSALSTVGLGCGESDSGESASGGAVGQGGAPSGGVAPSGGNATLTGGTAPTGGTQSATGGTVSTGGVTATGGTVATGGAPAGGTTAMGGSATGGASGGDSGGDGGSDANGGTAGGGAGGTSGSGGDTGGASGGASGGGADTSMNFFVTSDTSETGDIGGLDGADERCQMLAEAAGFGDKTWRAYLSTEDPPGNARDRIGEGPYYNAEGAMLAADKDALHERSGDPELFIDENGDRINGQWAGSPGPNQHDVLTGSQPDGTVAANATCSDWTSTSGNAEVGHTDGLGPNMMSGGTYSEWAGSHTAPCGDLASTGGAGKLYCFVSP